MTEQEASFQQMLECCQQELSRVASGLSPSLVLISFGPGGKTIMLGDVSTIHLALGTAMSLIHQETTRRVGGGTGEFPAVFAGPTLGNA